MGDKWNRIKISLFLLLVVLVGYGQISFFVYAVKWDFIDVVYPFRFFFSESLQAGYFPFWNPYLQTGTPFYADLQAPVFYPELLVFSLFFKYNVLTLNVLFVMYALIAAWGMYQLAFHFNQNRSASFLAAVAYAFSGYFIGHGQHLFLLVGAAWIPFVLVNYLRLLQGDGRFQILKTALFLFLMISGGYQALSMALFYLLLILFLYYLLREVINRNRMGVVRLIRVNIWLSILLILFSLPLIYATIEIISSVERLESGVSLSQTLSFGQSLKSVISFLLPSSTLKYPAFFGDIDLSMRNHHFGLIPLLFLGASLFHKRSTIEYLILGFGLVIFASSFSIFPVREFLFRYIPFMNLFKYAAFLRIFGLMAFILLAANYFAGLQKNVTREKGSILVVSAMVLVILIFITVYASLRVPSQDWKLFSEYQGLPAIFEQISFHQHIVLQGVFQMVIILLFLGTLFYHKRFQVWGSMIVLVAVIELFASAQTNLSFTVGDRLMNPHRMKKDMDLYPGKFPIPVDSKIIFNDHQPSSFPPFWRNTYVFSKQVSFQAFSSFELKSYSMLDDSFPNLRDAALNNHLFYFSDEIRPMRQFNDSAIDVEEDHHVLYLLDEDFLVLAGHPVQRNSNDQVEVVSFAPNRIEATTKTREDQFLTMLQTNFKGWKAFVDGEPVPLYTSNFNYRTILLTKGEHQICFRYENRKLIGLYLFSASLFFISVLFLIGSYLKKYNLPGKLYLFIPLSLLLVSLLFLAKRLIHTDENLTVSGHYERRRYAGETLFSYKQDFEGESERVDSIAFSGMHSRKIESSEAYFPVVTITNENGDFKEGTIVLKMKVNSEHYCRALIVSDIKSGDNHRDWFASRIEQQMEEPGEWNTVYYYRNVYDLTPRDVIQVYLWNLNKECFRIDDVAVDFYTDF